MIPSPSIRTVPKHLVCKCKHMMVCVQCKSKSVSPRDVDSYPLHPDCADTIGLKPSYNKRTEDNPSRTEVSPCTVKKRVGDFPVPRRDVTNRTLPLAGNILHNYLWPGRVRSVTSRLGTEKIGNLLLQCVCFRDA